MLKSAVFTILSVLSVVVAEAQSARVPLGSETYYNIDRVQTKLGRLSDTLCLSDKGEYTKDIVAYSLGIFAKFDDSSTPVNLTSPDVNNLHQIIAENREWYPNLTLHSAKPFGSDSYENLFVQNKNLFISVNPVASLGAMYADETKSVSKSSNLYTSGILGAVARGRIGKRVGFELAATANAEQLNDATYSYAHKSGGGTIMPGAGVFTAPDDRDGHYFYGQLSGAIDFEALKNHVNVSLGNGKHFIGDGTTSLFLTDFSANMPYLQVRARVWKLNYDVIYAQLVPSFNNSIADATTFTKYTTMHYITLNVTRWMNLGFFESVIFSRSKNYELSYLNPIALTIAANGYNGEYDKSLVGLTSKFLIAKRVQLYAQMMFNEFKSDEFFSGNGWYGNKWGFQSGFKYFDVFGVKNLDIQGEFNCVRPYSYTAKNVGVDYSHFNQPLADPLGAGFMKYVGIIHYQPTSKLVTTATLTMYRQGLDTANLDLGNNILIPYVNAPYGAKTYGVGMVNGATGVGTILNLNATYKFKGNVYVDLGVIYRDYYVVNAVYPATGTIGNVTQPTTANSIYVGLRKNITRRNTAFY